MRDAVDRAVGEAREVSDAAVDEIREAADQIREAVDDLERRVEELRKRE